MEYVEAEHTSARSNNNLLHEHIQPERIHCRPSVVYISTFLFLLCSSCVVLFIWKVMSKEEASTARAKVFEELGWDHLAEGDKKWAVIGHPKAFALF